MPKYEIMVIVDPKAEMTALQEIANSVFGKNEFKKLEQTELAYEIKKSKTAQYALINTETEGENIQEFTRRTNIEKSVWRILPINLDSETELKQNLKVSKRPVFQKNNNRSPRTYGDKREKTFTKKSDSKPTKEGE